MDETLEVTIRDGASGKLAILNGKTYTLLGLYRDRRLGGIFCLAVAGRTPLKADDLGEHWRVLRSGDAYLAPDCRPFSYHLIQGEGTSTDAPHWPHLKSPALYTAFIGPTEEAVQTQIRLTLERYHSRADPEAVSERATRCRSRLRRQNLSLQLKPFSWAPVLASRWPTCSSATARRRRGPSVPRCGQVPNCSPTCSALLRHRSSRGFPCWGDSSPKGSRPATGPFCQRVRVLLAVPCHRRLIDCLLPCVPWCL